MDPHERSLLKLINDQLRQGNWERVRFLLERLPKASQAVSETLLADLNDLAFKDGFPLVLTLLSKDHRLFRPNVYRLASARLYREPDTLSEIISGMSQEEAEVLFHIMAMLPREAQLQKWNQTLIRCMRPAWLPLWAEALLCAENPHTRAALTQLSRHPHPHTAKIAADALGLNDDTLEATHNQADESNAAEDENDTKQAPLIFVVDDSRTILAMVSRLIKKLGYQVQSFHHPPDALEQLPKACPDLVLTDLNMPECDGTELARRICMAPLKRPPTVILMTTPNENPNVQHLEDAGIKQVIFKPINKNVLQMTLSEHLNLAQPF